MGAPGCMEATLGPILYTKNRGPLKQISAMAQNLRTARIAKSQLGHLVADDWAIQAEATGEAIDSVHAVTVPRK